MIIKNNQSAHKLVITTKILHVTKFLALPFFKKIGEISPVATGDKGSSPLTEPPFEKGGRKLSN